VMVDRNSAIAATPGIDMAMKAIAPANQLRRLERAERGAGQRVTAPPAAAELARGQPEHAHRQRPGAHRQAAE
jgi:hypothetical protein